MTTINGVPRDLLERVASILETHSCYSGDQEAYAAQDLRALLAEQPQAGAGQAEPVETDAFVPGSLADLLFQLGEKGVAVAGGTHGDRWQVRLPQPAARQDQGDEVRRLREALEAIQSRASNLMDDELFDMCDAALTHSPKGAEE